MQYSKTNGQTDDVKESFLRLGLDTLELPEDVLSLYTTLHSIYYYKHNTYALSVLCGLSYEWNAKGGFSDTLYKEARELEATWESELEARKTQELT